MLRDIARGTDPQIAAAVHVIAELDADILVLTAFDYDRGAAALGAFAGRLTQAGADYPHRFALAPNTGVPTGLDLDGDGRRGGPRDAQGFGLFPGNAGMAVLSRLPLDTASAQDLSGILWRDLPDAGPPPLGDAAAVQRLSTTGHWVVPVVLPDGRRLNLLVWYASPPVFDGPEDRNGRRNHDETALWLRLLDGRLTVPPTPSPLVVIGDANLDPADGEGRPAALTTLLNHPALQDPKPRGTHGRHEPDHGGDPALDTALFDDIGGLRLDYVLPSADLTVAGAGVLWPGESDPLAPHLSTASRHRPVWVDIALP